MENNTVLLDLDAYGATINTIKAQKLLGHDLKIGDLSTESWMAIQKKIKEFDDMNDKQRKDVNFLVNLMIDQCYLHLVGFNKWITKDILKKMTPGKLSVLLKILNKNSQGGFLEKGPGASPKTKSVDTSASA